MTWQPDPSRKSYCCNGKRIAQLRNRLGWTQEQLARTSGYSLRLISKAESGRPISIAAIETIAQALSTDENPVAVEELVTLPGQLAQEFVFGMYRFESEVIQQCRPFLHDEICAVFSGSSESIPFAGEHRGIDAVDAAFRLFFKILQTPVDHDPSPHYQFFVENNEAICWGQSWFHPRGAPPLDQPVDVSIRFVFDPQGKLVLFEDRFDSEGGSEIIRKHGK